MEAEMLPNSGETLLIVDDEPLMTELFQKFMTKRGFRVLAASSGKQALELIEQEGSNIGLVMTDMTMPEMDGMALARELAVRAPALPVLLATGHDADADTTAHLPNIVLVVRKPYQNRALAEQIRELLDARSLSG